MRRIPTIHPTDASIFIIEATLPTFAWSRAYSGPSQHPTIQLTPRSSSTRQRFQPVRVGKDDCKGMEDSVMEDAHESHGGEEESSTR